VSGDDQCYHLEFAPGTTREVAEAAVKQFLAKKRSIVNTDFTLVSDDFQEVIA
jgi:hypothetical protein